MNEYKKWSIQAQQRHKELAEQTKEYWNEETKRRVIKENQISYKLYLLITKLVSKVRIILWTLYFKTLFKLG